MLCRSGCEGNGEQRKSGVSESRSSLNRHWHVGQRTVDEGEIRGIIYRLDCQGGEEGLHETSEWKHQEQSHFIRLKTSGPKQPPITTLGHHQSQTGYEWLHQLILS